MPPIGLFSLSHPVDNSHNNHSHYGNFCANSVGRDFYMLMHGREVSKCIDDTVLPTELKARVKGYVFGE